LTFSPLQACRQHRELQFEGDENEDLGPFPLRKGQTQESNKENEIYDRQSANSIVDIIVDLKQMSIDSNDDSDAFVVAATSCSAANFWKKTKRSPNGTYIYIETILECSRTLSNGVAPLQLQETAEALLTAARQCVKAATEQTHYSQTLIQDLWVAAHALRALSTNASHLDAPDVVVKLLYHAIVTLSDRISKVTDWDGNTHAKGQLKQAIAIGVALCETLGHLLKHHRVQEYNFRIVESTALFSFPIPTSEPVHEDRCPPCPLLKIGFNQH
jgi:hypothetical protein